MNFQSDYRMLIDGELVTTPATMAVVNPATAKTIAEAPDCSREQLDATVAAAWAAFPAWRELAPEERAARLKQAAGILMQNVGSLERLLTSEQGKPHDGARREIEGAAYWLKAVGGMTIPVAINEDTPARRSITRHIPLGVVGGISPWNFPVLLSFMKIAPALMTGNTMVLKPSPFTPLTILKIGELLQGVFPPGVFNVVTGGDALGPWMTSHPGINKISFTGSTATGKRVMSAASADLKRVTLELGGNDAAIVLPDVDVKRVARSLFWGAFLNSGQVCIAAKRVYVHSDIYDEFSAEMVEFAKTVKMGDGSEQGTQLGPIQNRQQYNRVRELIEHTKSEGGRFLIGGETGRDNGGFFIPVSIVDNPPEGSRVVQEEAFGPVLPLLKFDDIDDVVKRANASDYGLGGSVWSSDIERAQRIAERLETGTVWINEIGHLTPFQAFAGHKQSGLGIENSLDGLLEYTVPQSITVKKAAS
jgi:acyl-CoA reductase-like NAD-dependent aldehyde dehydrogenase